MTSILHNSSIRQEIEKFFQLAIPLASAQLAQSLTGFFDTIMMGRLGVETLAGGGLASLVFFAVVNIAAGIVMAVSPLVAEAKGAENHRRIEDLVRQGFWLSLLLSIPITIAIANFESIMLRLGQPEATVCSS